MNNYCCTSSREKPLLDVNSSTVAIVIPCYNEAETIGPVIDEFKAVLPQANIYVIDNNSTDDTASIAQLHGGTVFCETRQGKGFALEFFSETISADYYILVDGDSTYPASYAVEMLNILEAGHADIVVGDRMQTYTETRTRRFHNFGNKLIKFLINTIYSSNIHDPLSGYRAFTRKAALHIPLMTCGFDIETEITIQALMRRMVIHEIPVPYRDRPASNPSKLNTYKDGIMIVFRIFLMLIYYKPLTAAIIPSTIFFLIALFIAIFFIFGHQGDIASLFINTVLLVVSLTLIISTMSCGIILHVFNKRIFETQKLTAKIFGLLPKQ